MALSIILPVVRILANNSENDIHIGYLYVCVCVYILVVVVVVIIIVIFVATNSETFGKVGCLSVFPTLLGLHGKSDHTILKYMIQL